MATLAYVSGTAAFSVSQQLSCTPVIKYALKDEYKPSNFFSKFNFWTDKDPSGGYISYQGEERAKDLGLIKTNENDVRIGVEYKDWWPANGRESVRIQGKDEYDGGLFITDFSHFPKPVCGAWPAFWMYGPTWPDQGEIDLYEGWHDPGFNHITGHTFDDVAGNCKLIPALYEGTTVNKNCDVDSNQYYNEGCGVKETNGQWGKASGGVYAMEWTPQFIKVWSWGSAPSDVVAGKPDPTTWGNPHWAVSSASCTISKAFQKMKFVFNVDICGGGPDGNWESSGCKASTGIDQCYKYAADAGAQQYKDVYFGVRGIKIYQKETSTCPAPSSALPSSSAPASSSVPVSSWAPVSSAAPSSAPVSSAPVSSAPVSSAPASSSAPVSSVVSSYSSEPASYSAPISVPVAPPPSSSAPVSWSAPVSSAASSSAPVSSAPVSSAPVSSAPISSAPSSVPSSVSSGVPVSDESSYSEPEYCSDEPEPSSSVPSSVAPSATPSSTPPSSTPPSSVSSAAPASSVSVAPSVVTSVEWTTSTVYDCVTETITSCVPGVTNCPVQVVTRTIATSTTVCPVTVTSTSTPAPTWPHNGGWTTSTVYSTKVYTISKCPPTVTNCPYGHVTTELVPVSTTVCPVTDKWTVVPKPTGPGGEHTWPAGGPGAAPTKGSGSAAPSSGPGSFPAGGSHPGSFPGAGSHPGSGSGSGSSPVGSPSYNGTYTGAKPVTAGSAKLGSSVAAVLAGALLVMGL